MSLKLNSSGGGSVTLQEPTTASNVTLNLPAADATVLTDSAGVLNIGSGQVYKDASGNVGIGTSSPLSVFDVVVGASGARRLLVNYDDTIITVKGASNTAAPETLRLVADNIRFNTGTTGSGTERARIDSNGNLLVGCTAAPSASVTGANWNTTFKQWSNSVAGTATSTHWGFINPNGTVGSIQTTNSSTSYNTSSDYRLKENIAPMTGALSKVVALKPCTYQWKVDGSDGEGFIAHELAEVVPQCVTGEKDAVDADGNPVYQGIDTSFLVATLTAGLQEAVAMIEELKAKVAALEAQ
jgi:hypothetical protein